MAARVVPYTQVRSLDALKSLVRELGDPTPRTDDEYHRIRSQIFAQLEHLSTPFLSQQIECLSNDQLLTHAENVGSPKKIFPNHPAAHERLDGLARRYIQSFEHLQIRVASSGTFPREEAKQFINNHNAFRDAYVTEYKSAYPAQPTVVKYTRLEDIIFLKRAINSFMDQMDFCDRVIFLEKMKDLSPEILLLIPKIAFLAAVKSQDPLPQLFECSENQIQELRGQYQSLTSMQQDNLLLALQGKSSRDFTSIPLLEAIERLATISTRCEMDGSILKNVIENY
ncbi:MAG: hypothetical protein V4492_01740 [Chlamydiota bacterium]